jgi:sulfide:quinone oxidoreductase
MKPHIVVLGGNFAGLGSAQKIRQTCGDTVRITVVDRKDYLLFVPNIPAEVYEDRDPSKTLSMDLRSTLAEDDIEFIQGEVKALDVDAKRVDFVPNERPGAAAESLHYDYVVVAVGNRLAFDKIEGFAEHGHTCTDFYYGNKLRRYLHEEYKGGPVAIGSARFHQGDGTKDIKLYGGHAFPSAEAACEGPPVETMLATATWLKEHGLGGPEKVTVFTPASLIAEDAGEQVVGNLLESIHNFFYRQTLSFRHPLRYKNDGHNGQECKEQHDPSKSDTFLQYRKCLDNDKVGDPIDKSNDRGHPTSQYSRKILALDNPSGTADSKGKKDDKTSQSQ